MERYFTLSALIIISAMAVTDSLGDELQARWDMRIGYDRPIFQHLLNHYSFRERKETWPLRKESLLKLIEEYPDSTYAADAKLLLARGMFACEDDTEGAMRILYQVIQQHPDTPTIISSPTGEIDEVWLQNAPSRGRILADGTVRISPFPEIITAADRHFAEVLFYFEHREKFPNYAADVARLMAGGLLAKLGQLDKSLQEYEAVIRRHNGGKEILEADRLAGDMEHGILVAQSSRALVTAYAYIFHTHLLNENYAEAIKYGLTLAELRPSFDGRGESRLAEICVKAGDFETAEYLYEISLERFLNAAPRIYRDAETNITLLNQLLGAIEACRIARQTGKYDLERVTTNRGPFALERSRLNTWPPEDHEVRAKRRIREMDESYLRRSGGRWVKTYSREYGQRLWSGQQLDLY